MRKALTVVGLMLTACTSSGGGRTFVPHAGQDAVELARQVPACTRVAAAPPSEFASLGTVARCTIDGYAVTFYSFRDTAAAAKSMYTTSSGTIVVSGVGWMAMIGGSEVAVAPPTATNGSTTAGRRAIATKIATALGGKVEKPRR